MPNCANVSVGVRPLQDLRGSLYQGKAGGLYPSGSNERPALHTEDGVNIANTIVPLDSHGSPSASGKIGVVAIGFSITKRIFAELIAELAGDNDVSPAVKLVNAAFAGRDATDIANPSGPYWNAQVPTALAAAGITAAQVQVIWFLSGQQATGTAFPQHAEALRDLFVSCMHNIKNFFPNAKICTIQTSQYQGYFDGAQGAQEPAVYEQQFSAKWLIEKQINGDLDVNFDSSNGPVVSPWLTWGFNPWCDGVVIRSDGVTWNCPDDVTDQGQHPSTSGAAKLVKYVIHGLKTDPVCRPWFLKPSAGGPCHLPAAIDLMYDGHACNGSLPLIALDRLPCLGGTSPLRLRLAKALPGATAWVMLGTALQADPGLPLPNGGYLNVAWTWIWQDCVIDAAGCCELQLDEVPNDPTYCGQTFYAQAAICESQGPTKWAVTEVLKFTLGD